MRYSVFEATQLQRQRELTFEQKAHDSFRRISESSALINDEIQFVLESEHGQFWTHCFRRANVSAIADNGQRGIRDLSNGRPLLKPIPETERNGTSMPGRDYDEMCVGSFNESLLRYACLTQVVYWPAVDSPLGPHFRSTALP